MRVLVLGGGVIGVSSAWYLSRQGFDVTLVDRQPGAGLETSFGNAGQISPGYASPWAAPGVPLKAIKWLFKRHAPLSIRPTFDPAQYRWLWQMLQQCTAERYAVNKSRMVRIAEYSRDCLDELRAETGLDYEGRQLGTVQLFRTQKQLDDAANDIAVLDEYGVRYEVLDRRDIARLEPGLAGNVERFSGGLRLPGDQTGDCHLFTQRLAALAARAGVEFRYGEQIESLLTSGRRVTGVRIGGRVETADRYVLALGSYSPQMLKPLGIRLPVYPLKGYSLTLPIVDASRAPVSTVMDETYKVGVTRFENRIRVGGMAEVVGYDHSLPERRRATLEMVVRDLYPDAGELASASFWTGLRPTTPDGTPVIGATAYDNLYLNTGHGTLGWTMACGSGRYLADVIAARTPGIVGEGLDIARYLRRRTHELPREGNSHATVAHQGIVGASIGMPSSPPSRE